jgi:hypothetical protein
MVDSRCLLQIVTEWYFLVTEILSMVFHVSEIFQWSFPEMRFFQCYRTNFPFFIYLVTLCSHNRIHSELDCLVLNF